MEDYYNDIVAELRWNEDTYLYVAGEYTFCYMLIQKLLEEKPAGLKGIIVPTTERIVYEKVKEDGTVEKTSQFKFVMWRQAISF